MSQLKQTQSVGSEKESLNLLEAAGIYKKKKFVFSTVDVYCLLALTTTMADLC